MKCYYQTINKDLLPTKSKILVHLVLSNMGIKTAVFVQIKCIQRFQNVAMWNITCTTFSKTQLKGGGEGGKSEFCLSKYGTQGHWTRWILLPTTKIKTKSITHIPLQWFSLSHFRFLQPVQTKTNTFTISILYIV
jgi:hypothetical protein